MIEHGSKIVDEFNKNFDNGEATISNYDFSKADELGLSPNADDYSDWFTAFKNKQ